VSVTSTPNSIRKAIILGGTGVLGRAAARRLLDAGWAVKRIIDQRSAIFLAHRELGGNHTTAALNTAALIERVAIVPGARILNSADPDAPNGLEIARAIASILEYEWRNFCSMTTTLRVWDGIPGMLDRPSSSIRKRPCSLAMSLSAPTARPAATRSVV
jgi:hypothetical protein